MKMMTEIKSDVDGVVTSIDVDNGELVDVTSLFSHNGGKVVWQKLMGVWKDPTNYPTPLPDAIDWPVEEVVPGRWPLPSVT